MTEPTERPGWVPARSPGPLTPRREIDWSTTIIAAGSFLLHFGALSSIYSDWADPPVDDDLVIQRLVETARDLPVAPELEAPLEAPEAAPKETAAGVVTARPATVGERGGVARSGAPGPARGGPRAADLSRELDRLNTSMLAALRASGPSTDRVLTDSTVPFADLDRVVDRAVALRPGLAFEAGSRPLVPGDHDRSLRDLGNRGEGEGDRGPGKTGPTKGPKAPGRVECPTGNTCDLPAPDVPDAPQVIARLQGMFRRCYQNGLDREDPEMAGSVRVTARIGPNGEVVSTTTAIGGTVSGTVATCIASKVAGAQFSAPKNGQGAVLVIPVGLKKQ